MRLIKRLLFQHFYSGRFGEKPQLVVIHIAQGTREQVSATFRNEEKSSHYLVNTDGSIWQFVKEEDTSWAQGKVLNPKSEIVKAYKKNPNPICISVEHEGTDNINEVQYVASAELIKDICSRWGIPLDRTHIIGHREIRNDKSCPAGISIERLIELAQKEPEIEVKRDLLTRLLALYQRLLEILKSG